MKGNGCVLYLILEDVPHTFVQKWIVCPKVKVIFILYLLWVKNHKVEIQSAKYTLNIYEMSVSNAET